VVADSSVSPPAKDSVTTFDLCHGPVKGFKKGK
jgi:hypothetical protein